MEKEPTRRKRLGSHLNARNTINKLIPPEKNGADFANNYFLLSSAFFTISGTAGSPISNGTPIGLGLPKILSPISR